MKTRTGFVSNSSSSSFIISFDRDPSNKEDLAEMLGDCGCDNSYRSITTTQVVDIVHQSIMSDMPANMSDLMAELGSSFSWDMYKEFQDKDHLFTSKSGEFDHSAYNDAYTAALAQKVLPALEQFKSDNKDKFVYILSYDDDGSHAAIESGECFGNVEYKRVSHH